MEETAFGADDLTRGSQGILSSGNVPYLGGLQQLTLVPASQDKITREADLYGWLLQQANELRSRQPDFIDWGELAEELDEIVALARKETVSRTSLVLMHLLKWKYQTHNRNEGSWENTIARERFELSLLLESSNLLNHLKEKGGYLKAYDQARKDAAREMSGSRDLFPMPCEWAVEVALDPDFFPTPIS
jgi:hypothetical protein